MEWQVVGVIITIATLLGLVAKPIISLNTSITRLTLAVENLQSDLRTLTEKNDAEHKEFRDSLIR